MSSESTAQSPVTAAAPQPRRGQLAKEEEAKGIIQFRAVKNDGNRDSFILLTGLKNIYQKQLPKMPREYIARLVYDRRHESMAIVKSNLVVVGGITFRSFPGRQFAEIVFCAITSSEQVKGYGSHLMNHLKAHVRKTSDVVHFLTYADNYAVGYFKKQGFTADITLDRSIWAGYIKDYEGGTIMQCTMVPKIDYLNLNEIIDQQKKAITEKIHSVTHSKQNAFPGLSVFKENPDRKAIDPFSIPGVVDSGWHPDLGQVPEDTNPAYPLLRQLLNDIQAQTWTWPFLDPVDPDLVPGYYELIKEPMDLRTMEHRVETNFYTTLEMFTNDFTRMVNNCRIFNDSKSVYVKCANKLENFFKTRLKEVEEYQKKI